MKRRNPPCEISVRKDEKKNAMPKDDIRNFYFIVFSHDVFSHGVFFFFFFSLGIFLSFHMACFRRLAAKDVKTPREKTKKYHANRRNDDRKCNL